MVKDDEELEKEKKECASVVRVLIKAISSIKTYGVGHPNIPKFIERTYEKMKSFLEEYGSLILLVESEKLIYKKSEVYSQKDKTKSIPFFLYKNGIRMFAFVEGLSAGELKDFINICSTSEDEDLVNEFWIKDFKNIWYYLVEDIPDEAQLDLSLITGKMQNETTPPTVIVKEEDKPFLEIPDYFAVDQEEITEVIPYILKELKADEDKLKFDVLFDTLIAEDDLRKKLSIITYIKEFLLYKIKEMKITLLAYIIKRISSIPPEISIYVENMLEELREQIGKRLEKAASLSDEYQKLAVESFGILGKDMLSFMIGALKKIQNPVQKGHLKAHIMNAIKDEPTRIMPYITPDDTGKELMEIFGDIAEPTTISYIKKFIDEPYFQETIINICSRIGGKQAREMLFYLLVNGTEEIKLSAIKAIRYVNTVEELNILEKILREENLWELQVDEAEEIIRLISTFSNPYSVDILARIIRYSGSSKLLRTVKIAAIYGLSRIGTEEAYLALKRYSRIRNKSLRIAVHSALKILEGKWKKTQ